MENKYALFMDGQDEDNFIIGLKEFTSRKFVNFCNKDCELGASDSLEWVQVQDLEKLRQNCMDIVHQINEIQHR
jgi:hypothetical protein